MLTEKQGTPFPKKSLRAFFGIRMPEETIQQLRDVLEQLKNFPDLRVTLPENLHITLQFIDRLDPEHIPMLTQIMTEKLANVSAFNLILQNLVLFPNETHPRVISLDTAQSDSLQRLASKVGSGLLKMKYTLEKRLYRPHLTLARIKDYKKIHLPVWNRQIIVPVKEIILFHSEPTPDKSVYLPLQAISLQKQ